MVAVRICFIVALLLPALSGAEETSLRTFQLPEHGSLQLSAPRSWKDKLRQPPQGMPPTIAFTSQQGNEFQVFITPLWNRMGAFPDKDEMLDMVLDAAEEAKQQAVERNLPISEMRGDSGIGYYFSATDRAPKPGEFKYLTQGILQIGELVTSFTILSNDGGATIASDALRMLKGAHQVFTKAL